MAVVVFVVGSAIQAGAVSTGMIFTGLCLLNHLTPADRALQLTVSQAVPLLVCPLVCSQ